MLSAVWLVSIIVAPGDRRLSLTWSLGNPVDQRQAEDRKAHAELEHNASHAAAKAGPFNLSSSGAVAVDNKNRRDGKADQIIGSGKEFVGNTIGSDSLKREGRDQNAEGQGREAAGQLQDYTSGVGKPHKYIILHHCEVLPCTKCALIIGEANRVTGTIGAAMSGLTGNTQAKC